MSLAMVSVLTNLMVITSIRRKEEIMAVTFNMVSVKNWPIIGGGTSKVNVDSRYVKFFLFYEYFPKKNF